MKIHEIKEKSDEQQKILDEINTLDKVGFIDWKKINKAAGYHEDRLYWKDGKICSHNSLKLGNLDWREIPYPFGLIDGEFSVYKNDLTSLKNCPYRVNEDFMISDNALESFEGAPKFIGGDCYMGNQAMLESLHDIHKHFNEIKGGWISIPPSIKSHILGLVLIKGLVDVTISASGNPNNNPNKNQTLSKAVSIIQKYLGKGRSGVLDAQNELIENDLEDFAKL